jgi:transcriptional regulator with XRE-family HTH domain
MKLKVGNKLLAIREERKLNQAEMSELLNMSVSAYQRLERSETFANYEQIMGFSKILEVPIQEFLPDTITLNNTNNQHGQGGIIFGNIYNNYNYSDQEINKALEGKNNEIEFLKEKISLLEATITDLRNTVAVLQREK